MATKNTAGKQLRQMIIDEMIADYSDALEKNFEVAKQLLRLTKDGKVDVIMKDNFKSDLLVALYLTGKKYSERAGLADSDLVDNSELYDELGLPKGTVNAAVKALRDKKIIETIKEGNKSSHRILANYVERILKEGARNARKEKLNGTE